MKKFQGLGRSLSKEEQKGIKGGYDEVQELDGGGGCGSGCSGSCSMPGCSSSGSCVTSGTTGKCLCAAVCG